MEGRPNPVAQSTAGTRFALKIRVAMDQLEELTGDAALTKLRGLLAHFSTAFMAITSHGHTRARPIGVVGNSEDFDGTLWFITDRRSHEVSAITGGAETTLLFQSEERGSYAHIRGRATIVDDRQKLATLCTPEQRTGLPGDLADRDMTLIRFGVADADYWDDHNSTARQAVGFFQSVVTGRPGRNAEAGFARVR